MVGAVGLAATIPLRNQGRQRQESLVAKLLRESVQDADIEQLQVGGAGRGGRGRRVQHCCGAC